MVFEAIAGEISIGADTTGAKRAAKAIDNVGDEAAEAGAKAAAASGGFAAFGSSATGATGATASLGTVITATLIPSIVALTASAGTAAVALGGIATAATGVAAGLGAVVGSGALVYSRDLAEANKQELQTVRAKIRGLEQLEDQEGSLTKVQRRQLRQLEEREKKLDDATTASGALQRRLKQLGSTIADQLIPVGEQFDGLIRDFINGLPDVTQAVIDNLGPLDVFAQALRDAGTAAAEALPGIVNELLDLGRAAIPRLRDLSDWLGARLPDAYQTLKATTADVLPEFIELGKATLSLTGEFIQFGRVVTNAVVPSITDLFRGLEELLKRFNGLPGPVQDIISKFAVFAPVVIGAATAFVSLSGALKPVVGLFSQFIPLLLRVAGPLGVLVGVALAVSRNFAGLRDDVELVVGAFADQLQPTVRTLNETLVPIFNDIANAFGATETSIVGGIDRLATAFAQDLADGVRRAGVFVREGLRDIKGYWDENRTQILQTVRDLGAGVRERFQSLRQNATRIMRQAKEALVEEFRAALPEMRQNASQIVSDLRKSFNKLIPMFRGVMNFLLENIIRPTLSTMAELWDQHGSKIMSSVSQLAAFLVRAFRGAVNVIRVIWDTWGTEITGITRFVIDLIGSTIKTGLEFIISTFDIVTDLLVGDWDTAWTKIVSGTKEFLSGLLSFVTRWGQGWLEYMDQLLGDTIEDWVQWALDVGKTVRQTFTDIGAWINNKGRQLFGDAWTNVIDMITQLWNDFYTWIIGGSFFPDLIRDIASWLTSRGRSAMRGAFETIVGAIENTLNSIDLGGISDAINGIIDAAEDAISAIADIPSQKTTEITRVTNYETDVSPPTGFEPDDGDGGGGGGGGGDSSSSFSGGGGSFRNDAVSGGTSVGLARGGYVTGPTAALIGEGSDDEFVTPASTMERILRDVAKQAMSAGGDGGGDTNIVIEEGAIQAPGGDPDEILDELERRLQRIYPNA